MKKIFVTGISGTGKTSIAEELERRKIRCISIDEVLGLCSWVHKTSGETVNYEAELNNEFINTHNWVCNADYLKALIQKETGTVVVTGMASNQDDFLDVFDRVLLLQCKPETFIDRINKRVNNDFGKDVSAQKNILSSYEEFETVMLRKGAISIDVDRSLSEVVDEIQKHLI